MPLPDKSRLNTVENDKVAAIAPDKGGYRAVAMIGRVMDSPIARALLALALVLLLGVVFNADGAFFAPATHQSALRQMSIFGILACGMTLVIITGGIDLAVGSILALTSVCFALMSIHWGWSPWLAIPAALAIGAVCGALSGGMTAWFGVQPFIATLAMMVFARGLAKWAAGGTKITTAIETGSGQFEYVEVPWVFNAINSSVLYGSISMITIMFILCALMSWLLLSWHRWGRQLYAIGGNEEAARLSGVPVKWSKAMTYLASGFFAGVAGLAYTAQAWQGDPMAGIAYELTAIAIVVIGGTNLMGGRGGIGLTVIGTLTIGYLDKVLSINAVPDSRRLMLTGTIIIVAVMAQRRRP